VYEGRWEDAVEWYARGVALLEGAPPSRDLWLLESNLSVAERRAGRLERSAEWLERAERTAAALDDGEARLYVENARGMLLAARGDHAGAEAAFRRALEGGGTPSLRGSVLTNLADALLAGGRAAEAERVLRELELLAVARGLAPVLPYVYRGLGAVARARGDAEGFLFYEQALELCRRPGSPPVELAATQHEYARFEEAVGQTESARERLREALEIYARLGAAAETARAGEDLERLEETLSTDDPA
jgi:tetratricopeptide (TPR) repeat protein